MPAAVASQWVDVTTPKVPWISGRVVKPGMIVRLPMRTVRVRRAAVLRAQLREPARRSRSTPSYTSALSRPISSAGNPTMVLRPS